MIGRCKCGATLPAGFKKVLSLFLPYKFETISQGYFKLPLRQHFSYHESNTCTLRNFSCLHFVVMRYGRVMLLNESDIG